MPCLASVSLQWGLLCEVKDKRSDTAQRRLAKLCLPSTLSLQYLLRRGGPTSQTTSLTAQDLAYVMKTSCVFSFPNHLLGLTGRTPLPPSPFAHWISRPLMGPFVSLKTRLSLEPVIKNLLWQNKFLSKTVKRKTP